LERHRSRPRHRWKSFQEIIDRVARFQIVEQCLHRDARSKEYRRASHHIGIASDHRLIHGVAIRRSSQVFNARQAGIQGNRIWAITSWRHATSLAGANGTMQ